ncbi:transglutaminase-like domain-containing protein [Paenibacillus sp. J5C_2022]|uniref:transglutaminase-like domain-containing protein n=1 Tax=Paenibacillus sp. J5C2022 TaxID=2977129 RepID=UPI0021D0E1AC|nr:transglutaminase-like domain-containing protein [Paenibacillus sp. J5C2022]MCU6711561.1 transglutaminase-like domain-containing protein [Paenibacillus sp. J5C2022]
MFGYIPEFKEHYIKLLHFTSFKLQTLNGSLDFVYDMDNNELSHIRNKYELTRVAGDGNELSRLFNIMNWLHEKVKHANVALPEQCNAIHILELAKNKPIKMNCYVLATVLNELMLSLGFYSRRIHCRSYDPYDLDSHVVTSVFSRSLSKWIYLDPSWNVYVTDDKGTLLGLEEFRERLRNEQPVWVNGNPEETEWTSFYIGYMAKNLFWFNSPQISTFDYDESERIKTYSFLLPDHFKPYELNDRSINEEETSIRITNNPREFWRQPI